MKVSLNLQQKQMLLNLCSTNDRTKTLGQKILQDGILPLDEDIEVLCTIISDEFMLKGIKEDFEPNVYGKDLEILLDAINKARLHTQSG